MPSNRPRGSSFDRDAARQAWRQFARVRGIDKPRDTVSGPKASIIIAGVVIAVATVFAFDRLGRETLSPTPEQQSVAALTEASMTPSTEPAKKPDVVPASPATADPGPSGAAVEVPPAAPTRPRIIAEKPTPRIVPVGSDEQAAKAYLKVPKGKLDRAPIGGVGASGIHIDRLTMGTAFENSDCTGPANNFSISAADPVSVCFRAVHLRQRERLRVVWEHEGRRALTTRLSIPGRHAYKTRAGLQLNEGYAGRWRVSIRSADDTELASTTFDVVR